MSRNRIIYNSQSVFIGPAPSSGFHYIDVSGNLSNTGDYNLVRPLNRVQSLDYSFIPEYIEVKELGKRGLVSRPIINHFSTELTFDYLQRGIINELRMGFFSNYVSGDGSDAFYSNNFSVSLISGFVTRDFVQPTTQPYWPYNYRDKRNIFVVTTAEGVDVYRTEWAETAPEAQSYNVFAFGDCYLNSYQARAAINSFPVASVGYVCENLEVIGSGSGCQIPALSSQSGNLIPNKIFSIPSSFEGNDLVSVLLPGDIRLSFSSTPALTGVSALYGTGYSRSDYNNVYNLGVSFSDIKIQNYDINLDLNRKALNGIGYKIPSDRIVTFPVYANIKIGGIVGDLLTGNIRNLFNQNDDYNLTIRLNNPSTASKSGVGVQYDFKRAKFNGISYDGAIGPAEQFNMSFTTEIDPDDLSKGFFMSGLLNISEPGDFLETENSPNYLLSKNDNSKIKLKYTPLLLY